MTEQLVRQPVQRPPTHPGEILREDVFPVLGISVSETARRLGISRQQLQRVLSCARPVTAELALRIGKFAGNGPGLWLRMQQVYDLWHAERRMRWRKSRRQRKARHASEREKTHGTAHCSSQGQSENAV